MAVAADTAAPASRALSPTESGYAVRGGVRVAYEVFGAGEQTLLLLPPWAVVHSRFWKLQVPYLARHFRVVTFDARGNGRSASATRASNAHDLRPRGRGHSCPSPSIRGRPNSHTRGATGE